MEVRNYETVFIVTPVLNESQVQETVEKFTQVLKENSADILSTLKPGACASWLTRFRRKTPAITSA